VAGYCPNSGDIIWLDFLQPAGNEQAGRRPALVLSPRAFNELTGRCIACPITSRDRDWSFHVAMPEGHEVRGVVQTDQIAQCLLGATRLAICMRSPGRCG
jgi:mRNA interferase MazF